MEQNAPRVARRIRLHPAILPIVLIGAALLVVSQWFVSKRQEAMRTMCINNLRCIGTSISMYESDWDDRLPILRAKTQQAPKGLGWPEVLVLPTHRSLVHEPSIRHPSYDTQHLLLYSFNSRIAGMTEADIERRPQEVIMVFDSVNDSVANNNLHGDIIWRPKPGQTPPVGSLAAWTRDTIRMSRSLPDWARPRHGVFINVCFADGHATSMEGWDPQYTLSPR